MKRRLWLSFFIALALYLIPLMLLFKPLQQLTPHKKRSVTTLSLQNITIQKPSPPSHPTPPIQTKKPKPQPKPKPKKREKKRPKKFHPKKLAQAPLPKDQNRTKKITRRHKPKEPPKTSPQAPSLASLFKAKTQKKEAPQLPKEYRKLYKDEFDTFTKEQKRFLRDNLAKIGAITQKYLYLRGYPYIAIKTRQQGTNIVQFYLHPNGDISDLRLIGSSGYAALDKNSIETIKAAYKDYPRPKEKTKIKIYVKYRLIY